MRGIIILCFLATTVLAAPQAGYHYNQQHVGHSLSSPNIGLSSQAAKITNTQENHGLLQQTVNSGILPLSPLNNQAPGQQLSLQTNFGYNGIHHQHQQQSAQINNFGGLQTQFDRFQQQQQQQQYQLPGTVTKDIYVHVAPEEAHEQQYQQRPLPQLPPRKHYRIVFIKAPSHNTNNAALRIQQAPTEEKTIIYVLTKKPDTLDLQNAIQAVQPKQPSKPEVYFIKYKTKEEAQHAQRTIQAQYDKLGGVTQVSDEGIAPVASVIGALDNTQQQSTLDFSNGSGYSSTSSAVSSSSSSFTPSGRDNNGSKYLPPIVK